MTKHKEKSPRQAGWSDQGREICEGGLGWGVDLNEQADLAGRHGDKDDLRILLPVFPELPSHFHFLLHCASDLDAFSPSVSGATQWR